MRNSLSGLLRLLAVFALVALARASTDGGEALRHDLAAPAAATESSSPLQTADQQQIVLDVPPSPEQDAQTIACKPHALALSHLSLLPSLSSPSSPIPPGPQVFLTLSTAPVPGSEGSFLIRLVTSLRDRFWREGYNARLVGGGLLNRVASITGKGGKKKREEVVRRLAEVQRLLEEAIEGGCAAAWETHGRLHLFPPAPMMQNLTRGLESYQRAAALTGSPSSHSVLAFFHASAYAELLPRSPAAALTHWSFSALAPAGHSTAEAALGWRNWAGVGVEPSCEGSLAWWERAARRSYATFIAGPPGGRTLPPTPIKLSDLALGAYGLSSSVASSGNRAERPAIKAGLARQAGETWEDILEYYEYQTNRGGKVYEYQLAKIFYTGSIYNARGGWASGPEGVGLTPHQNFALAQTHFTKVARTLWPSDSPVAALSGRRKHNGKPIDRFEDKALTDAVFLSASMLGRMHLRGEVKVRIDNEKDFGTGKNAKERIERARDRERWRLAKLWFERGAEFGEREAHNGLGIMYRDGLGVKQDIKTAFAHFTHAAGQDLAEAQVNLAKIHLSRNEVHLATNLLHQAARSGSPFEAYYHLGMLYAAAARGSISAGARPETCGVAIAHLKQAAERGCWGEDFGGWLEADRNWERGETDKAILGWWMAGERGVESAQNNLAFLLDQDTPAYTLPWRRITAHNDTAKIAMNHWMRSAAQDDVDALVKLGDYHFKGLTGEAPQMEKAAGFYQAAAESQVSAMAYFNLGYMYEHGLGVPQDWHLAKRNYDLALTTDSDAALPVNLALLRLYARSVWASFTGQPQRGLSLWSSQDRRDHPAQVGLLESFKQGLKGWSLTSDELEEARAGGGDGQDRQGLDGDGGGREAVYDEGDWIGTTAPGDTEFYEDDDEAWFESMLLMFLCLFVAFLSWLRNRWLRQQTEERERAAREAARAGDGVPGPAAAPDPPPLVPGPPWPPFV